MTTQITIRETQVTSEDIEFALMKLKEHKLLKTFGNLNNWNDYQLGYTEGKVYFKIFSVSLHDGEVNEYSKSICYFIHKETGIVYKAASHDKASKTTYGNIEDYIAVIATEEAVKVPEVKIDIENYRLLNIEGDVQSTRASLDRAILQLKADPDWTNDRQCDYKDLPESFYTYQREEFACPVEPRPLLPFARQESVGEFVVNEVSTVVTEPETVKYIDNSGNSISIENDKAVVYHRKTGEKIREMSIAQFEMTKDWLYTEQQWLEAQAAKQAPKAISTIKAKKEKVERKVSGNVKKTYCLPPAATVKAVKPGSVMAKIVELLEAGSTLEQFEAHNIGTGRNGLSHFAPYINKTKGYGVKQIGDRYYLWLPGQAEPTEQAVA